MVPEASTDEPLEASARVYDEARRMPGLREGHLLNAESLLDEQARVHAGRSRLPADGR